jgi:hypothetical protein
MIRICLADDTNVDKRVLLGGLRSILSRKNTPIASRN